MILTEPCRLHDNNLYIEKDSINDYKAVNKELARYFSNNDRIIARQIRFVSFLYDGNGVCVCVFLEKSLESVI